MDLRFLVFLLALAVAQGYHILCIITVPSRSHNHLGQGIVNALLNAGHEVTWVTPYPPKEPRKGLHIIDASVTKPIAEAIDMNDKKNANSGLAFVREFSGNVSLTTARVPALRRALVKGGYDAVLTETFFSDVDAGYAAVLQVPWLLLSGIVLQPTTEALVDEVRSVPILPLLFNDFNVPMSFVERLKNIAIYSAMTFDSWWHQSESDQLYQTMFASIASERNVPLPPLSAAVNNVSILFVNSHSSFANAQSVPPNVVDIGGYHIEETVPSLPKDLQELMDSSPVVIYFSMGSVLKSSALPDSTKREILKMFGELPYTVLWKFEEELKGLPKNVHIRSWMPQAAILAHKNTKVFITHGGLLSNLETLKYGVPLITVPVFGDQPANAARAVRSGYALRVPYDTDTMADGLRAALKEMLGTDKYSNRIKYLSSLFNNRPVPPKKLIAHYVELAIQSKGAFHLRSKANLYAWYQRWMLDVLAVVSLALFIVGWIALKIIQIIAGVVCGTKGSKKKVKKN